MINNACKRNGRNCFFAVATKRLRTRREFISIRERPKQKSFGGMEIFLSTISSPTIASFFPALHSKFENFQGLKGWIEWWIKNTQ